MTTGDRQPPGRISHYRVGLRLGAGGMGEVYLSEDTRLGRRVAIKLLPPELTRNSDSVRRFIQEARAASALNHPNIVTVHDIGECDDGHYLVMELVSGKTLRILAAQKPPLADLLPWFEQMARALTAAHAAGITHRDIKPENIMVRDDGYVKVLDFGLARLAASEGDEATATNVTMPGQVMGTVKYMSPEQARGEQVGNASDIFSLGLVFYELAAGRYPFHAESTVGYLHAINSQTPPVPAGLPAGLCELILRMLSKSAPERPLARDIATVLSSMAKGDNAALTATAVVLPERTLPEQQEKYWVAVLPFQFRGQDSALRHLTEGLSEDIVAGLSRFSYLRVLAHGLTAKFGGEGGAAVDARTVGKQLGARYVLEGSLRQTGPNCRLAVRLAEASTGAQLWADTYDRRFDGGGDLFAMQDEWVAFIVARVADQHGVLVRDMSSALRNKKPEDLTAHEAVLSVFGFHERMSPGEHARVRGILERLVRESPDSSDCWAMLATIYSDEHMFGFPGEADPLERARSAAQRAMELAPSSPLSCQAMAQSLFFRKEWSAFRPYAERTIAANPLDSATCAFIGMLLALSGSWDAGCQAVESAIRNNPHHPGWYWLGLVFRAFHREDFRAAIEFATRVNMPGYFWGPAAQASAYGHLDDSEEARRHLRELLAIRPDFAAGAARAEFEKWFAPDLADRWMEGLERAGLDRTGAAPAQASGSAPSDGSTVTDSGFWVAVTPFKAAGAGADLNTLADGLTGEITSGLTRFSYLRVIGRGTRRSQRARYVVEGNLRLAGATVRLAVQLTDTATGVHLWSETYTRPFRADAIFDLQDDLAVRIVTTLADAYGALPQSMSLAVRSKPLEDLTPYEALLRSFSYAERLSLEEHAAATQALEHAVEQAPGLSDCWAMLSLLLTSGYFQSYDTRTDTLDRALAAARTAVARGPANHLAHQSLAWALSFRKEHGAAVAAAERTISLNPFDACAKVYMSSVLMMSGGAWERGASLIRDALPLNPNHPGWYRYPLFCEAYRRGDYRGALDHALQMNMPDFPLTHVALAAAYGQLGETAPGAKAIRDLLALRPDFAKVAEQEIGKTWDDSLTAALVDGLRKAGLGAASPSISGLVSNSSGGAGRSVAHTAEDGFWVAVPPFRASGPHSDFAALGEGFAEEIIAGLSRFPYLRVLTKGTAGARYILEGNLRQAGTQLRVAVRLIETTTGASLWAENYNRPFSPEAPFEVQEGLVPTIVSTVGETNGVLTHSMWTSLRDRDPLTLTPYEAMLRCFGGIETQSPQELTLAVKTLERAVEQEPRNSSCLAMLAVVHATSGYGMGYSELPDPLEAALSYAQRAVACEPSNHLAHHALATVQFFRRETVAFRTAAERALALNPMDGYTLASIGMRTAFLGDWDRGCDMVRRSMGLNPRHPGWYWFPLFTNAYRNRDFTSALSMAQQINMPGVWSAAAMLAAIHGQLGNQKEARQAAREFAQSGVKNPRELLARFWSDEELLDLVVEGWRKAGFYEVQTGDSGATGVSSSVSGARAADEGFWVAVPPFRASGTDPGIAALGEGFAEEIIAGLSRFPYLRVLTKGTAGARYILEGNLRQAGPQLRIAVRLIETTTGASLWAENYTRPFSPEAPFEVQENLVPTIVSTVGETNGVLTHSMWTSLRDRDPLTLTPYEAMLRCFGGIETQSPQELTLAVKTLERAVEQEPRNSSCLAMLAVVHATSGHGMGYSEHPDPLPAALSYAQRAVAAEPSNHLAHHALATVQFFRRETVAFRTAAERALTLNPMDGYTLASIGMRTAFLGDWDRGCDMVRRSMALNPRHPGWYWFPLFTNAYRNRDFSGALAMAQQINMPGVSVAVAALAAIHGQLGNEKEARQAARELAQLNIKDPRPYFERYWIQPELIESFVEGWRKAGVYDASPESDSGTSRISGVSSPDGFWVAVLPFESTGSDAAASFAAGLFEETLTGMSRFSYLRVIARSSVRQYAGSRAGIRAIGSELGARYVLEGSARHAGSQIRVTVQLSDVRTGRQLWTETFNRPFDPAATFALQDELAPRIVSTVSDYCGVLVRAVGEELRRKPDADLTPHEAVLLGCGLMFDIKPDLHLRARAALEHAVEANPADANCWLWLAMMYGTEVSSELNPLPDSVGRGLSAARRAVDLDPANAMARLALAFCHFLAKQFAEFRLEAQRAIDLNPWDGASIAMIGLLWGYCTSWDEGEALIARALSCNSIQPGWHYHPAFWNQFRKQNYPAALELLQKAGPVAHHWWPLMRAAVLGQMGETGPAREALAELLRLRPDFASTARTTLETWHQPEMVETVLDGLRKAGLDTPAEPVKTSSSAGHRVDSGFWVAVLPFEADGSSDVARFANGLFEETLTGMSRFSYLRLIARASVRKYEGTRSDVRTIGRELGARYVMEGSVRQAGSQIRLTVQISDVSTGVQLWTETFNRPFDSEQIFALQDELAPRIVSTVSDSFGVLARAMSEELRRKPDEELTPHDAVLLACGFQFNYNAESHLRARTALQRAVVAEPGDGNCWSWLAMMFFHELHQGFNQLPDPIGRCLAAAKKGVDVAPTNSLAHCALALAHFFAKRYREFRLAAARAIELNPWDGAAIVAIGTCWSGCIDREEGEALVARGLSYNPAHPPMGYRTQFWNQYGQGNYAAALEVLDKAGIRGFAEAEMMRAAVLGQLGETGPAREALEELFRLRPESPEQLRAWLDVVFTQDMLEHILDGLRKAGLDTPAEPAKTSSSAGHRVDSGFWVAVLPFEADGSNDVARFASGLFEETLTGMSRFPYLRLIARASVRKYAGARSDVQTIGRELGARYVMEGSVRQAGAQIRLTVQVSDVSTGAQLWTETFNRPFDSEQIFALQDELAPRIVSTVSDAFGVLVRAMTDDLRRKPDEELTPHDAVLLGFGFAMRVRPAEHLRARTALEQAVKIAPDDANCWAMLSSIYYNEHLHGLNLLPDPVGRALKAARRAVDLDPTSAMGHHARASAHFFAKRFPEFRADAERAIQLNPWDGLGLGWIGTMWAVCIDWDEGEALTERARAYNPTHPSWYQLVRFWNRYRRGQYTEALALLQSMRISASDYTGATMRASVLGQLGQTGPAREAVEELVRLRPDFQASLEAFFQPEMVEHILDGLRKAGLDPPAEPAKTSSSSAGHRVDSGFWVAVLPFEADGSSDVARFANGLFEETLTGMSRFPYLRLIARSSVRKYAGARSDVRTIGRDLGARFVMEGSVRQAGAQIRLTMQISDVSTGAQLWTETFNHPFDPEQIFALQDELAPRIVSTVSDTFGVLVRAMADELRRKPDEQLTPHDAVLLAFGYIFRHTPEDHLRARTALERAVVDAPDDANCWAMLSTIYLNEYMHGLNPLPDPVGRALAAAQRAVEFGPTNSMAHYASACANFFVKRWTEFRAGGERAIQLNPWDSLTLAWVGTLWALGIDWEEGEALVLRAQSYNPTHPNWYHNVSFWKLYRNGEYQAALALLQRNRAGGLDYNLALMRAAVLGQLGQTGPAREALQESFRLRPDLPEQLRPWLEAFFHPDMAEHCLDGLRKAGLDTPAEPVLPADSAAHRVSDGFWVAVIPFESKGSDAAATFADGLFEETLTGMSRFSYLRLIARSSVRKYAGSHADIRAIGQELGARYVMEGSVRQAGAQIRLTVQISDVSTGAQLWTETFNRAFDPEQLFALQDELAPRIVSTVSDSCGVLVRAMSDVLRRKPDDELTAHEAVLLACGYMFRTDPESHLRAREALERAVAADPGNANCWLWLATLYAAEQLLDFNSRPDVLARALAAARKAVDLDPANALAHMALAYCAFLGKQTAEFRLAAQRAMDLNPWDGACMCMIGYLWGHCIDWDEGEALTSRALAYSPTLPGWSLHAGLWNQFRKRNFPAALELLHKAGPVGRHWWPLMRATIYGHMGETARAREAIQELLEMRPDAARQARSIVERFHGPEMSEHILEGLAKAGLLEQQRSGSSAQPSAGDAFWIAVAPFRAEAGDVADLAAGLAAEIITGLSRFSYLRVLTKGTAGARYLLEGTLRQAGAQVRLSAKLIDTATGANLWAETYTRPWAPERVFEVQDDLASVVASTIADAHGVLPRSISQELRAKKLEDLTPYEAVLRSFAYSERATPEELAAACEALRIALRKDPDHADALAMLSFLLVQDYGHGFDLAPAALTEGAAFARRAVEIAPASWLAWRSLTQALFFLRDLGGFRHAADRAVNLNPQDADTLAFVGELLLYCGDSARGLELSTAAKRLSPNHSGWYWYADVFHAEFHLHDSAAALAFLNRIQLDNHYALHLFKASVLGHLGQREAAARSLERFIQLRPDTARRVRSLMQRWWSVEQVDHLVEGLHKAGLSVDTGSGASAIRASAATGEEGFRVAVAPFRAESGGSELAALASGLSGDIVTALSRFHYLRVLGSGTAGARYVLEGSLRQAGSQLRVAVRLIDTASGANLWAETFSRAYSPDRIFDIQDDLVPVIVSPVAETNGVLEHNMWLALRDRDPMTLSPYEALLRSRGFFVLHTEAEHRIAVASLRRAIEQEPNHAGCLAALSWLYSLGHLFGWRTEENQNKLALDYARRAVEAEPSYQIAHVALLYAHACRKEIAGMRTEGERVLELNPVNGMAIFVAGMWKAYSGDWQAGCALVDRARQLNPRHIGSCWYPLAHHALRQKDYAKALEYALRINMPGQYWTHLVQAVAHAHLGHAAEATAAVRELLALEPDFATTGPAKIARWFIEESHVELLLSGLRKAGLNTHQSAPHSDAAASHAATIVVLPFDNTSADAADEYFADGLTEEVISGLAGVAGLRLISRSSSMSFKNSARDAATVVKRLAVTHLVTGSVRKAGGTLRITAELVDARNEVSLWSEKFNGTMEDVFRIQEEIGTKIVAALQSKLAGVGTLAAPQRQIQDAAVYDCYLRARHEMYTFDPEAQGRALKLVDQAIAIAGENPLLLALRGQVFWNRVNLMLDLDGRNLDEAASCAQRALQLDPNHANGLFLRGIVYGLRGEMALALRDLSRAHQLRPEDSNILIEFNRFANSTGVEHRAQMELPAKLDPLSAASWGNVQHYHWMCGHWPETAAASRRMLELAHGPASTLHLLAAWGLAQAGERAEAIAICERVARDSAENVVADFAGFLRFALLGDQRGAMAAVTPQLERGAMANEQRASFLAAGYALIGRTDEALRWIRISMDRGYVNYPYLAAYHPFLDSLRRDPAFHQLMAEVKLRWQALGRALPHGLTLMPEPPAELLGAPVNAPIPSLAVLPFANLGGDQDQQYFSDGLAEEILNLLAQLPGLKTIARTSSFAFRGREEDIRSIAATLNVTHVLQGSVRRSAGRIRVSAQLIGACDGSTLWSERYDRKVDDLFALQDEIAAAITTQLKVRVAPGSTKPRRQPNLEAYESYLRYRQHQFEFTPEALKRSRECLERAIALDPEFALPHVGLADHFFAQTQFAPAHEWVPKMRDMAARALSLDPGLSEAQAMQGILTGMFDRNWAEAERWFVKALAHPLVHWHVRVWYAWFYLQVLGRSGEAQKHVEIALVDNPLNHMVYWAQGAVMEGLSSPQEAARSYARILAVEPGNWMAAWQFALQQARQGEFQEARRLASVAMDAAPWAAYSRGTMAGILIHEGKTAEAQALLSDPQGPVARACAAIVLSDADGAASALIEAMEQDYVKSVVMLLGPHRPFLQQSSRWNELHKCLELPPDLPTTERRLRSQ